MNHPSRGGVRGGKDQFEWESVKTDKHRENYLGHSVMAPVGRWQKGKDLTWYAKDKEAKIRQQQTERNKIKQLEEEAMAAALGFGTVKKRTSSLTKQEIAETLKRGQTERDSGDVERVEGMGFGSSRAAMMDSSCSNNDGFVKEPQAKIQQVRDTTKKDSTDDENKEGQKKKKKKKKHKANKSDEKTRDGKRSSDSNARKRGRHEPEEDSDAHEEAKRNKYKEKKTNRKRERPTYSGSEDDSRFKRGGVYKDSRSGPIKRRQRHDSNSSNDEYQRSKARESRTNRDGKRRQRHDSD